MNAPVTIPYSLAVKYATVDRGRALAAFATWEYPEINLMKAELQRARDFRSQLEPSDLEKFPPLLDFSNYDFPADGRFHKHTLPNSTGTPVGMPGLDLSGVDFTNANLAHVCLAFAKLTGAVFNGADLEGTDFRSAKMRGAILSGANNIDKAIGLDLTGSDLDPALKAAEAGRGLGARRQAAASTERHP